MAFKPDGIELGGITLDADSAIGNQNFYKAFEGFLESTPQSIYQTSIIFRTPISEISKELFKTLIYFFILK